MFVIISAAYSPANLSRFVYDYNNIINLKLIPEHVVDDFIADFKASIIEPVLATN